MSLIKNYIQKSSELINVAMGGHPGHDNMTKKYSSKTSANNKPCPNTNTQTGQQV